MRERTLSMADLHVAPSAPLTDSELPKVTVVVLNFNGRPHLERCFESLRALSYPADKLDVLLIDNASDDGSVEEARSRWPWVRVVVNERNVGFAAGCNQGAALRGDSSVLAFLNNDVRVDERWLRELVYPIVRGDCAATTSKMLLWDGKRIDSAGGGMSFYGIGFQYGYAEVPGAEHDVPRKALFPCGGAMAIDAGVFDDSGGFDPEFFAYYEDVDLGWRLWVLGHEVRYAPGSVCWHHHHGTSRTLPPETVRLLQVRNPLYACFKNYDDEHLRRILPVALALVLRRTLVVSGIPGDRPFRIEDARPVRRSRQPTLLGRVLARLSGGRVLRQEQAGINRIAVADLLGANDLLGNWRHWMRRRAEVQSRRRRCDEEIFRLFLRPMWPVEEDPQFRALLVGSAEFFGVEEMFAGMTAMPEDPAS